MHVVAVAAMPHSCLYVVGRELERQQRLLQATTAMRPWSSHARRFMDGALRSVAEDYFIKPKLGRDNATNPLTRTLALSQCPDPY